VRTTRSSYLRAAVLGDPASHRDARGDDEGREQLAQDGDPARRSVDLPRNYRLVYFDLARGRPLHIPDDLRAAFPIEP